MVLSLPVEDSLSEFCQWLKAHKTLVLSGAGISTESGIPDYRGPVSRNRPRRTIRFHEFVRHEEARKRYWAGSMIGWPLMRLARPNRAHVQVAALEAKTVLTGVITQNVDGLHQAAGTEQLVELHGNIASVYCLTCKDQTQRQEIQQRLLESNPGFHKQRADLAPDGDADVDQKLLSAFTVPSCLHCGGILKPAVVFFGENVPKERVDKAMTLLDEAQALLVLGSSLTVYSGYRFVLKAKEKAKPVFIINQGETRADALADLKMELRLGEVLSRLGASL